MGLYVVHGHSIVTLILDSRTQGVGGPVGLHGPKGNQGQLVSEVLPLATTS